MHLAPIGMGCQQELHSDRVDAIVPRWWAVARAAAPPALRLRLISPGIRSLRPFRALAGRCACRYPRLWAGPWAAGSGRERGARHWSRLWNLKVAQQPDTGSRALRAAAARQQGGSFRMRRSTRRRPPTPRACAGTEAHVSKGVVPMCKVIRGRRQSVQRMACLCPPPHATRLGRQAITHANAPRPMASSACRMRGVAKQAPNRRCPHRRAAARTAGAGAPCRQMARYCNQ